MGLHDENNVEILITLLVSTKIINNLNTSTFIKELLIITVVYEQIYYKSIRDLLDYSRCEM